MGTVAGRRRVPFRATRRPVGRWQAALARGLLLPLALLAVLAVGCGRQPPEAASSVSSVPVVHVVKPELRNLTCTVDQPGFVDAYEQTAIYSKVSGFIKQYYVDIGHHVKKGDPMVEIFVPELDEDHQQKVAQVELDRKHGRQVAESKVKTAIAQLAEAKANVGKYQADIVRWESEVRRLTQMVAAAGRGPGGARRDPEATLRRAVATRDAAQAAVAAREAAQAPPRPTWKPPRPRSRWPRPRSAAPRPCWPIPR